MFGLRELVFWKRDLERLKAAHGPILITVRACVREQPPRVRRDFLRLTLRQRRDALMKAWERLGGPVYARKAATIDWDSPTRSAEALSEFAGHLRASASFGAVWAAKADETRERYFLGLAEASEIIANETEVAATHSEELARRRSISCDLAAEAAWDAARTAAAAAGLEGGNSHKKTEQLFWRAATAAVREQLGWLADRRLVSEELSSEHGR